MVMKTKRCPLCKHPKPWIVRILPLRGIFTKYFVECRICYYCGPAKIGKKRAIKAWDKQYEYFVENVWDGDGNG